MCKYKGIYHTDKLIAQKSDFCAINDGLIESFTENSASDADECASFLDGQRVIVGHAHGDFLELVRVLEVCFLHFVEETGQYIKFMRYLFFVFRVAGHTHYTRYAYII